MRQLRDEGVAIVFVSHFLDQIYEISDRMTILRNGRLVEERMVAETSQLELVKLMIGRELETLDRLDRAAPHTDAETGTPVLRAVGLGRKGSLEATDLDLFEGEVVGIAGLLGSGRTELARLLFGADTADTGELTVRSERRRLRSPRHAIDRKIAFSSEDRKAEGVVGDLSVADNMLLALQASRGWLRPIPQATRTRLVDEYVRALDIRPADPSALMRNLSGGNQQKVLLARWLITEPDILILDEPTRGIDIGAKAQIQAKVAELAAAGHVGRVHLRRAGGGAAPQRPAPRHARPPQDRRAPQPRRQRARRPRDHRGRGPRGGGSRCLSPRPSPSACSRHPLLWPVLALVVLLVVNVAATPSFLDIRMQDGHLYGNLVDILRNSAPVMLVALGMTLVIATRGIDLSVGAIAAIAGAVACTRIVGAGDEAALTTARDGRDLRRRSSASLLGAWNGFLVSVLGIQPIIATLILMVAGRGISMAVTDGQITTVNNPWFSDLASGYVLTLPLAFLIALARARADRRADPAYGAGHAHRGRRDQPRGQPAGRRAGPAPSSGPSTPSPACAPVSPDWSSPPTPTRSTPTASGCGSSSTRSSPWSSAAPRWPAAASR